MPDGQYFRQAARYVKSHYCETLFSYYKGDLNVVQIFQCILLFVMNTKVLHVSGIDIKKI